MLKNSLFLIFMSLFGMLAYSSNVKKKEVTKLHIPTDNIKTLKGEVVLPDLFLGYPGRLLIIGNNLLLLDRYEGKWITLVDLDNPKNTERLLHRGNGHNEIFHLRDMFFHEPNNALAFYDIQKNSIRMYKIEDHQINVGIESLLFSVTIEAPRFGDLIPLGDKYVINGSLNNHQLDLYDKNGQLIQSFGTYPGDKDGIDNPRDFHMKTQGLLAVSPNQKHFALAGVYNDQLAFYKATDAIPEKIREYFSLDAKLEMTVENKGVAGIRTTATRTSLTTDVYSALASTNKNLYVLYLGLTTEELKSKSHDETCTILVFDWNGNLTQVYDIPDFLSSRTIAVDERNNCLYGMIKAESGEMQIMKYQL